MKIKDVQVIPLSYPIDDYPPRRRFFALLKMTTDEGVVGWGEASDCYGHHLAMTVKAYVDEQLRWWLLDQDPLRLEEVMTHLQPQVYRYHGHKDLVVEALSAVEIAMWDIRGKVLGKPISELLGKYRDSIPLYAANRPAFFVPLEQHMEWATPLLDRGVTAVKIRLGNNFDSDARFVRDFRQILPDNIGMLVDGKNNYLPDSAIRMSYILAEAGAICFEEPVNDRNLDELARVAAASPVPLAYGEHSFTVHDFRELITRKIARILTPDATVCGGISTSLEVAKLAFTFGHHVEPHCGGLTAVGMAANLHVAAAMPGVDIFEFDSRQDQPLRDELPADPIFALDRIVGGQMPVPTGPGLGIEVDESVFEKYPYRLDTDVARSFATYGTPHI